MNYLLTIIISIICYSNAFTQKKPDFCPPVKHKIVLSGSFGELRSGHFHSGLDIKSERGVVGDSIFSIYDGYIGRIKVEPSGYGNSIYIIHPNGYTSVYAHLKSFTDSVERFTYQEQLSENCFTIDTKVHEDLFKIKKGDFIGYMGNSGKSFGPHLHFEIRNTSSDILINPITLGIKPEDTRHPVLNSLTLYEYDDLMNIISEEKITISRNRDNIYKLKRDSLSVNSLQNFSLSINLFDRMNGASNKNGVYSIQTFVNGTLTSNICFDSIQFEDSNNTSLLLDEKKLDDNKSINYLFNNNLINPFSFSETTKQFFEHDNSIDMKIVISDYESNESSIAFRVSKRNKKLKASYSNFTINESKESLIQLKNFLVLFKEHTFQQKQGIRIVQKDFKINDQLVHSIFLNPKYHCISKPVEIIYKPLTKSLNQKYCFVYHSNNGSLKLLSNCDVDTICKTNIDKFENVFIFQDTISPIIKPLFQSSVFAAKSKISFFVQDNLDPTQKSQYLKFDASLNNTWILFKYDLKSNTISYQLDENLEKGKYDLQLQVTDNQNNTSCYFTSIKIK